jgi:hypothetical protein
MFAFNVGARDTPMIHMRLLGLERIEHPDEIVHVTCEL